MISAKTKAIAATLGVTSTLLLAGCGNIAVNNANGVGSCGGNQFHLTTTQNATGTNIEINYTGPEDVALFYVQGFYSDLAFTQQSNMDEVAMGLGNDNDVVALRLETDQPGWTSSGSGANTTYHYSGDALTLLDARDTAWTPNATDQAQADMMNSLMPSVIGVDCDVTDQSDIYGPSQTHPVEDLGFEAAQMVFPKEQSISPFEITESTAIANGAHVTMRYTPEALTAFGSFDPAAPGQIMMAKDMPSISNDSIKNLWDQFEVDNSQPSIGSITSNGDGTFSFDITGNGGALADGNYIVLGLVPNADETDGRWVFSSLHYEAARGFNVEDPFTGNTIGHHYTVDTLANTGADSWLLAQIALGTIALGAVLVFTNRRKAN